jgi:hypothetical protein
MNSALPVRILLANLCLAILYLGIALSGDGSLLAAMQDTADLTVTAVGDVRVTARLANNRLDEIRRIKLRGDIVFASFEGALSDFPASDPWKFAMPLESVDLLKRIGFNAYSLANNHSLDLGEQGYQKTILLLA